MSFAPGQFLTAQRLNRLQPATYWVQATSGLGASATVDVPGASMSIVIQTNGATAAFDWSYDFRATGASGLASCQAFWDVTGSPAFAVARGATSTDGSTAYQNWVTTIPTAGTYTFKLKAVTSTNGGMNVYTALKVVITEVA
jgi:hypothetical protein